jgi:hypothetical protein
MVEKFPAELLVGQLMCEGEVFPKRATTPEP